MNVDPIKMMEQEPEFDEYVVACIKELMKTSGMEQLIKFCYSMYSAGIDKDAAIKLLKMNAAMFGTGDK